MYDTGSQISEILIHSEADKPRTKLEDKDVTIQMDKMSVQDA